MDSSTTRAQTKRAAILAAAAELIIENGYEGTSLDAVVERAACSKSAVYELFGNKEGVLSALTEDIAVELAAALEAFDREGLEVEQSLFRYGQLALRLILSPRHTAIVRATLAAAWKHPQMGRRYYEVGPMKGREGLIRYFQQCAAAGTLAIDDAELAAVEFQSLLVFERLMAQVAGAAPTPSGDAIDAWVAHTVSRFLTVYRPPRTDKP